MTFLRRFICIREDKNAEDATNAEQVAQMYKNQDVVKNNTTAKKNNDDFDFWSSNILGSHLFLPWRKADRTLIYILCDMKLENNKYLWINEYTPLRHFHLKLI